MAGAWLSPTHSCPGRKIVISPGVAGAELTEIPIISRRKAHTTGGRNVLMYVPNFTKRLLRNLFSPNFFVIFL